VLEAAGFRVLTHPGPSGCVSLILHEKPDLVLIDVTMPKLGCEAIVKLFGKASNSESIMLLFSKLSSEQLAQRAERAGAHGCIRKTEDTFELVRQLNRWLKPRELKQRGRTPELDAGTPSAAPASGQRHRAVKNSPPAGAPKVMRGSRPPPNSRPPPKTSGTSRLLPTVLFIDEMERLSALRRSVQGEPYRTDFALSAAQAIRQLESRPRPDLVVTSVEPAGVEIYERAVALDFDWAKRFVFLASLQPGARAEAFLKTYRGVVLTRPLDERALRDTLRRLLATHARPDERTREG
jgi:CheY-like chemotaxis protein